MSLKVLRLTALGILAVGCSSYSGPSIATPTPAPWIQSCSEPVYMLTRGEDFPDEIPTTFNESYPNLGDNWNDKARMIIVFDGAQVRIYQDEYVVGNLEKNFRDLSAENNPFGVRLFERDARIDDPAYGVSAIMIRKCPEPSISPIPSGGE